MTYSKDTNKIEVLKSKLTELETVRLPRVLQRIEELKKQLAETETGKQIENAALAITEEHAALYQRFTELDRSDSSKEAKQEMSALVCKIVKTANLDISPRNLHILSLRSQGLTLKEVGKQVNLTPGRVRLIQDGVYRRIRFLFRSSGFKEIY